MSQQNVGMCKLPLVTGEVLHQVGLRFLLRKFMPLLWRICMLYYTSQATAALACAEVPYAQAGKFTKSGKSTASRGADERWMIRRAELVAVMIPACNAQRATQSYGPTS